MAATENGLYFISIVGALLAAACATTEAKWSPKKITPAAMELPIVKPGPTPQAAALPALSAPIPAKSALVVHIQSKLPELKPGMSRGQVERLLHLDTDFLGVVNSEGTRDDFGYYYDLGDWELVLRFSYRVERDGAFTRYQFGPVPAT